MKGKAWSLAAAAAALFTAFAWRLRPAPPISAAEPPKPAVAEVKPKPADRKPIAATARVKPKKMRGVGLRDKGEALGGTTPDRVDNDSAAEN